MPVRLHVISLPFCCCTRNQRTNRVRNMHGLAAAHTVFVFSSSVGGVTCHFSYYIIILLLLSYSAALCRLFKMANLTAKTSAVPSKCGGKNRGLKCNGTFNCFYFPDFNCIMGTLLREPWNALFVIKVSVNSMQVPIL